MLFGMTQKAYNATFGKVNRLNPFTTTIDPVWGAGIYIYIYICYEIQDLRL